jgi:hypothetical protein
VKNILPVVLAQRVETKFISDLSSIHSVGQILLVSKNEQDGITQLILQRHVYERSRLPNKAIIF